MITIQKLAIFDKRDVDLFDLEEMLEDSELNSIISTYREEKYN